MTETYDHWAIRYDFFPRVDGLCTYCRTTSGTAFAAARQLADTGDPAGFLAGVRDGSVWGRIALPDGWEVLRDDEEIEARGNGSARIAVVDADGKVVAETLAVICTNDE